MLSYGVWVPTCPVQFWYYGPSRTDLREKPFCGAFQEMCQHLTSPWLFWYYGPPRSDLREKPFCGAFQEMCQHLTTRPWLLQSIPAPGGPACWRSCRFLLLCVWYVLQLNPNYTTSHKQHPVTPHKISARRLRSIY